MNTANLLAGRRILVVEDEYLVADEIVRTLSESGAEVLGAVPSVKSALAAIQSAPWLDAAVVGPCGLFGNSGAAHFRRERCAPRRETCLPICSRRELTNFETARS